MNNLHRFKKKVREFYIRKATKIINEKYKQLFMSCECDYNSYLAIQNMMKKEIEKEIYQINKS